MNEIINILAAAPPTGDTFPVKTFLVVGAVALAVIVVTSIFAGKNKKDK